MIIREGTSLLVFQEDAGNPADGKGIVVTVGGREITSFSTARPGSVTFT